MPPATLLDFSIPDDINDPSLETLTKLQNEHLSLSSGTTFPDAGSNEKDTKNESSNERDTKTTDANNVSGTNLSGGTNGANKDQPKEATANTTSHQLLQDSGELQLDTSKLQKAVDLKEHATKLEEIPEEVVKKTLNSASADLD